MDEKETDLKIKKKTTKYRKGTKYLKKTPGPKTKFDANEKLRFIDSFREHGNVSRACRHIGISLGTYHRHYRQDENFKEQIDDIITFRAQALESEAYDRAMNGVETPVYQQGQLVGTKIEKSDTLLKFMLTHNMKDKYSPHQTIEHKGEVTHNVVETRNSLLDKISALSAPLEIEDAEVIEGEALPSHESTEE